MGANSAQAKVKTKNQRGDIAGRDMHKTTYVTQAPAPARQEEDPPYIYLQGSFGGNGVLMRLAGCNTHNLSDQFIFLEHIDVLGRTMKFNDHIIKAGETISHTGIDNLNYPDSNEERFLEIFFKAKNGKQFIARQKLQYGSRQDGKFNITGLGKPQIQKLDASFPT
jgi:hypothetical protein